MNPAAYVDRWCDSLDIASKTREKALRYLDDVNYGRSSSAAAAGALWAALADQDERAVTQEDLIQKTFVSAYALRDVRRDVD